MQLRFGQHRLHSLHMSFWHRWQVSVCDWDWLIDGQFGWPIGREEARSKTLKCNRQCNRQSAIGNRQSQSHWAISMKITLAICTEPFANWQGRERERSVGGRRESNWCNGNGAEMGDVLKSMAFGRILLLTKQQPTTLVPALDLFLLKVLLLFSLSLSISLYLSLLFHLIRTRY